MSATRALKGWAGWACCSTRVASTLLVLCLTSAASGAEVLFPSPLHITRRVSTPFAEGSTVIDEYCHGNRVVSISGRRTAIADHAKGEVTVIDFAAGTYSITRFADIARLQERSRSPGVASDDAGAQWEVARLGGRVIASRPGERIEVQRRENSVRQVIRLTADRQLKVSRAAAEALLGTGYPNPRNEASDVVFSALRPHEPRSSGEALTASDEYFLPLEYDVVFEMEGERVETRNTVMRIGAELPPAELLAIPPGATLVDSAPVTARKRLEELDRPPGRSTP